MGKIQLKVYTYWKKNDKPEIRRLELDQLFFIDQLRQHLVEVYPALKNIEHTIMWKDEEGDDIVITTDKELQLAVKVMANIIRLHVHCKKEVAPPTKPDVAKAAGVKDGNVAPPPPCAGNYGVVCDGCEASVTGVRYKCTICDDYDLCAKCEGAGLHPDHFMLRIPVSGMPRTVIRAAIKRSRQILKTVGAAAGEDPCRRTRREKSGERKRRGEASAGTDRRDSRRTRASWLDTVAMYVNEFANLAGDIQAEDKTEPKKTDAKAEARASTSQKFETTTEEAGAPPTAPEDVDRQSRQAKIEKYAHFMREYLAAAKQYASETSTSADKNGDEVGQGDGKKPGEDAASDKESIASNASAQTVESKKDDSPDRVDDWTVINKEKDLMDACMKPSAPQEPAAPIGFNLPEEFQQRASVTQGQSLYPPLNVATAVLDPKEAEPAPVKMPESAKAPEPAKIPEAAKPKESAAKPKAAKATTPPRQTYHPMAHINAALEQMLNMGFTNDGGWLTQLLENKDGNIAAVLDLLTPVNPKSK